MCWYVAYICAYLLYAQDANQCKAYTLTDTVTVSHSHLLCVRPAPCSLSMVLECTLPVTWEGRGGRSCHLNHGGEILTCCPACNVIHAPRLECVLSGTLDYKVSAASHSALSECSRLNTPICWACLLSRHASLMFNVQTLTYRGWLRDCMCVPMCVCLCVFFLGGGWRVCV